jgi:UDP-N-acetylglucosamine transferase subunit ALG13
LIFVIMGMEVHPFDRLARAADELHASGTIGEEVFIQLGACGYQPRSARFERYLSFGEVCEHIQRASVVITHAGAGSTLVCIQQGKHPIMVPRRARLGEHVDEHQVPFTEKLAREGLVTPVYEMNELPAAIAAVRGKFAPLGAVGSAGELTRWLQGFWQNLQQDPKQGLKKDLKQDLKQDLKKDLDSQTGAGR